MTWKRSNWQIFILIAVVTVATLFGGQQMVQKYAVAKPLDRGLQEIQGVEQANWEEAGKSADTTVINVTLRNVIDLSKTYGEINATAKKVLGRKPFRIVIADHRTPELEQLYYEIHYYIQEAIFTGNFAAMSDRVQAKAKEAQVDARIYVDTSNVYLQLSKDGNSMYVVVPRQPNGQEAVK